MRNSFGFHPDNFSEEEEPESNSLPSFPDSPSHNSFSQAAIKDAVSDETVGQGLPPLPESEQKVRITEMDEWNPQNSPAEEMPESPIMRDVSAIRTVAKDFSSAPDVFVKIDKFHSAKKTLNEVKKKMGEVEELVKKIRETKMREEQELSSWEKDLEQVKSRLENVLGSIFEKVE